MRLPDSLPRIALLALVAVLVALAGCSSGGDTTTTAPALDLETTQAPASGDSPTPTPTDRPPATTTTGGITARQIAGRHVITLSTAGTFTTHMTVNVSAVRKGGRVNTTLERTIYANLTNSTGLSNETVRNDRGTRVVQTAYTAGNVTYNRLRSTTIGTRYAYGTKPYGDDIDPVDFGLARGEQFVAAPIDWTPAGQTTIDGTRVRKFTASGPEDFEFDLGTFTQTSIRSVESVSAALYVDGNGVVRLMELELVATDADGNVYRQRQTFAVTDVGSTTVPRPDWLENATN